MSVRQNIKLRFESRGQSIADWARENGYNPTTVYAVLAGRRKGKRGKSHKIAVALGIKKAAV